MSETMPKKNRWIVLYILLWFVSASVIVFAVFFRPNLYSFLVWNSAIKQDAVKIRTYGNKLQEASFSVYQREGLYYSLLSDILTQAVTPSSQDFNKKEHFQTIKKQIITEINKPTSNTMYTDFYRLQLQELLAWIYFNEKNYTEASKQYFEILIQEVDNEIIRNNYEISLVFENSFEDEQSQQQSSNVITNDDTEEPNILELFKIEESNTYRVFESQERDTNLPNY